MDFGSGIDGVSMVVLRAGPPVVTAAKDHIARIGEPATHAGLDHDDGAAGPKQVLPHCPA
jgi:hypothetical protein